jgi:formylglycine-generating enzyme required for sulfatase activity
VGQYSGEAGDGEHRTGRWTTPRYWDNERWNGAVYPVAGVSWYEAIAFCRCYRIVGIERVMLPTKYQWQWASQALPDGGDSGYVYPCGSEWDGNRCNHCLDQARQENSTSPITRHEGKGDSPCGVVDMVGNVWEWCLTDDENRGALRGGSWYGDHPDDFRIDVWLVDYPHNWGGNIGFRVVSSG